MIKVQNNTATREPLPAFLQGLAPESLADLSWTDAALGVQDMAWWPEEQQWAPLAEGERHGAEVLTIDAERKVVISTRAAEPDPDYVAPARHITRLAFRNRFAQAEKVALEIAALDNPAASMPQRQQSAALRATLADTAAATYIDLSRPDTRGGVQMLESAGLLAEGRALEILDAPIQPEERPL